MNNKIPKTILETAYYLRTNKIKPSELLNICLNQIKIYKNLNSYISIIENNDDIISNIDKRYNENQFNSIIDGIPISIKDAFCTLNLSTTAASYILSNNQKYQSPYNATCVEKLINNGSIIIGKTNMDEFCMGSKSMFSNYNYVLNPWGIENFNILKNNIINNDNKNKIQIKKKITPGGSSGGAAVSVITNTCYGAIGSDTGGSVRQPASFCNLVGLKPSYGRLSRYGLIAFSSSLDHPSILTKTIFDSSLLFDYISGIDNNDMTNKTKYIKYNNNNNNNLILNNLSYHLIKKLSKQLNKNNNLYNINNINENNINNNKFIELSYNIINDLKKNKGLDLSNYKIGIISQSNIKELNPIIKKYWKKTINGLIDMGVEIKEISIPHFQYSIPTYYVLASAEASSNLSRYDGIHYGYRDENNNNNNNNNSNDIYDDQKDLHNSIINSRTKGFREEVKRRILTGNFVLSASDYEKYYYQASIVRNLIKNELINSFNDVDFILTPTTPLLQSEINNLPTPFETLVNDVMTIPSNLAGIPSISIPIGKTKIDDNIELPIGMQLIGQDFNEFELLYTSMAIESYFNN